MKTTVKMEPFSVEEIKKIARAYTHLALIRALILTWAHERAGRLQGLSACDMVECGHHVLTFEERLSEVLAEIGWKANP